MKYYSTAEAARVAGISLRSIYRAIAAGFLKTSCVVPGRKRPTYRILDTELARYLHEDVVPGPKSRQKNIPSRHL